MSTDDDIYFGLTDDEVQAMDDSIARYQAACHAMQSGVAFEMEMGGQAHTPKHLRVGVNSAMVQNGTVVRLMVQKGIITWPEWFAALAEDMEREQRMYEERSGVRFG